MEFNHVNLKRHLLDLIQNSCAYNLLQDFKFPKLDVELQVFQHGL